MKPCCSDDVCACVHVRSLILSFSLCSVTLPPRLCLPPLPRHSLAPTLPLNPRPFQCLINSMIHFDDVATLKNMWCVCVCACMRARARRHVRACLRVCVCARARALGRVCVFVLVADCSAYNFMLQVRGTGHCASRRISASWSSPGQSMRLCESECVRRRTRMCKHARAYARLHTR